MLEDEWSSKLGRRGRSRVVGLTGSLASGKTTVLKTFQKLGWKTLSADEIVADIYHRLGITKAEILRKFGTSRAGIRRLEKWIHPLVKKEVLRFIRTKTKNKWLMIEVPLLFEAKFDKLFQINIYVHAPKSTRKKRAQKRGMPKNLFELLDRLQLRPEEKAKRSDFVVHNRSKAGLKSQAKKLSKVLK